MEQNTPGSPDPNSPFSAPPLYAAPGVWPPAPTNSPFSEAALAPMQGFQEKNVWLVLLLSFVTLGIYTVFWLRRQAKQIHVLRPDLMAAGVLKFADILFGLSIASTIVDVANAISPSSILESISNILGPALGLLSLALLFQVRNAFNMLIAAQKGNDSWFNGLYTFLLSIIYLQYHLNKMIPRYQAAPAPYNAV